MLDERWSWGDKRECVCLRAAEMRRGGSEKSKWTD